MSRSRFLPSPAARVLIALMLGLGLGLAINAAGATHASTARVVIAIVEPIGALFVNAIRMTVIPLVVSSLVVAIATSAGGRDIARLGGRGLTVFVALLVLSGLVAAIVSPPVLSRVALDPGAVASLRATSSASAPGGAPALATDAVQSPSQWLVSLVPPNAVRSAVDGAMLPLIVFGVVLGFALLVVGADTRAGIVALLRGVTDAMLVIVGWLLVVAPFGVFALALPLVARLGLSAVGALATYVVLVSLISVLVTVVVVYPTAVFVGRVPLRRFARAALPAQAVAFSSRSSIAALPALIESARTRLGMPDAVAVFILPLATALFRVGATLGLMTGCLFIARLYGIAIGPGQIATLLLTSVLTSFSIPGIPGGSILAMVPVLASVGLPIDGLGILLGVDTIPDIFRTTANVTGQLAAATVVARAARVGEGEAAIVAPA